MKNMFICLKISKIYFSIAILIIIIVCCILENDNTTMLVENTENNNEITSIESSEGNNETLEEETPKLEEYKTMPREISGYKVVGKIQISKINLEAYILAETNKDALNVSVTKLCGPEINGIGNFCIAGHNYNKFFAKIKNLEIKDNIILTDTYNHEVTYEVYDTFQTSPQDISCLNQDTKDEKELTLITCTTGAIKRIIVKAVEVYD